VKKIYVSVRWRTSHEIDAPDGFRQKGMHTPMPDWMRDQIKEPYDDAVMTEWCIWKDDTEWRFYEPDAQRERRSAESDIRPDTDHT